jgi:hypothetical protein
MNYDLAKELKDAGFRQWGEGQMFVLHGALPESDQIVSVISYREYVYAGETKHEKSYAPTLEELIEACGEGFDSLYLQHGSWAAIGGAGKGDVRITQVSTPAEAVARLWLALNRKGE